MPKIVLDVRTQPAGLRRLEALPDSHLTILELGPLMGPPRELDSRIARETEILVCTLPPKNHAEMTKLKFVQLTSVGYAQLYGLDLPQRGIRACNARGVYDTAIAEWNIGMMINLGRDLRGMIRNQDAGRWDTEGRYQHEIRGGTVGLWGYGGIGRETARIAKTMGMTVHVLTRRGIGPRGNVYAVPGTGDPDGLLPDRTFTAGQELEFLSGLDFLILAMPITPTNTGLLGERELRALKPTAFLLNPARGKLVQEEPLVKALTEGWFAGAALDTHYYYPMPPEHPLWRLPNVIMTPHISGSDKGPHFLDRFWEILLHNVEEYLAGRPLWNELTPAELTA